MRRPRLMLGGMSFRNARSSRFLQRPSQGHAPWPSPWLLAGADKGADTGTDVGADADAGKGTSTLASRPAPPRRLACALASIVLLAACGPRLPEAEPADTPGRPRLDGVADGDSFWLRGAGGERVAVRVAGIDAPEKDQPHADEARDALTRLLAAPGLVVEPFKTDPYGRQVARVRAGGQDVALAMVRAGLAWHFVRYAADQTAAEREQYARAEREARAARRGLWADPHPQPPWAHRQRQRP